MRDPTEEAASCGTGAAPYPRAEDRAPRAETRAVRSRPPLNALIPRRRALKVNRRSPKAQSCRNVKVAVMAQVRPQAETRMLRPVPL